MGWKTTEASPHGLAKLPVRVAAIRELTAHVKEFTLVPRKGNCLPAFIAGSHVLVSVPTADQGLKPYSLTSCPNDLDHYQIVVSKSSSTKGLSRFMHECLLVGSVLEISLPMRGIELVPAAARHVLIAGGMGVTPFLSQLSILLGTGAAFELHYAYRTAGEDAFLHRLKDLPAGRLFTYASAEGRRLNTDQIMSEQPEGTHFYVSGPPGLVESIIVSAWRCGLSADHFHFERGIEINASLSHYLIPYPQAAGALN